MFLFALTQNQITNCSYHPYNIILVFPIIRIPIEIHDFH